MINQTVLSKYFLVFVVLIVTSCVGNSGSSNTVTDNATKNEDLKHTDKEGIMERLKKQGIKDIKNISLGSG